MRTQSCVATGPLFDDADRAKLSAAGGPRRPRLAVATGDDAVRPAWDPLRHAHGVLCGTMTVTAEIPALAAHVAEVPPGVEVPSPPSDTPREPAPTAHPR